ncbi:MAG: WD40 repeat domain-containing protein [Planctomycetes bacterium]|nr:WD40 repeat domain-containing protein [Planctomycetota bacterium]
MTRCVKIMVLLAIGLFPGLRILADDGSIESEFARLSSDDPAVRDAATEAIVREGKGAKKTVTARMAGEKDPELRGRLAEVLERIEVKALREMNWSPVWTAEPFEAPPTATAISPDGKRIATGGEDGRVRVLDAATLAVVREFDTGIRNVDGSVAFSPDGTIVIDYDAFGSPILRAWRIADGAEICGFRRAEHFEGLMAWVEPGGNAVLLTAPGCFSEGAIVATLDGHRFNVLARSQQIRVSEDRTRLAFVYSPDGTAVSVKVFAAGVPEPVASRDIDLSDDVERTCDLDGGLTGVAIVNHGVCGIFDLKTGNKTHEFGEGLLGVRAVPGGWVTWTAEGLLQWWKDGVESKQVQGRTLEGGLAYVAAGLLVLDVPSPDPSDDFHRGVIVRSAASGDLVEWYPRAKLCGPWSDGAFVLQLGDATVRLYGGGKFVRELPQGPERPQDWSHTEQAGPTLVTTPLVPVVIRLDADTAPRELAMHGGAVRGLRWMPDGLTTSNGSADAILAADGAVSRTIELGFLRGTREDEDPALVGYLPDGPRWATPDGSVSAWIENHAVRVRRGTTTETLPLSDDDVAATSGWPLLALSGDGKRLAVFGPARTGLDIWDLESKKLLVRSQLADDHTRKLLFASDDRTLAAVDDDNEATPHRRLRIFDPEGQQVARLEWAGKGIAGDWVVGGRWVTGVVDGEFRAADIFHPDVVQSWKITDLDKEPVTPLIASPDGKFLLVVLRYGSNVWRLNLLDGSQEELGEFSARGGGAVLLPEGNAAVLLWDGLMILRAGTWAPVDVRPELAGRLIAASPDGRRIAIVRNSKVTCYEPR